MRLRSVHCVLLAILLAAGCSSMLRPKKPEPALYRLEYKTAPVDCPRGFDRGVRVSNFTADSPYNRTQMVVLGTGRQVMFSQNYQWVSDPGSMLAGKLTNDLATGSLFPQVVAADELTEVPLVLNGEIAEFACERTDSECEAVLHVNVSLDEAGLNGKTVFSKRYRLKSQPFNKDDSALFAAAMSRISGEFSKKLREDLCRAAAGAKQ